MEQTTLQVEGMACDGCEETVIDAVESLQGVGTVRANHEADRVRIEHDSSVIDAGAIGDAVENAGYDVVD